MQLNAVVLPAPFGPMSPTISHSPIDMEKSSSACRPPKRIDSWLTSSTDTGTALGQGHGLVVVQREALTGKPAGDRSHDLTEPAGVHDDGLQQQHGPDDARDVELVVD